MRKTYIVLMALLFTTISFAQKVNDDKTGFTEEIVFEGDRLEVYNHLKAWAEKRYKSKESKLKIDEGSITSKSHIPMAFRARQGKIDVDVNYKFYYDLEASLGDDKVILKLIPTEVDVEMPGSGYIRIENSMYQYLIVDEKVNIGQFKEIAITGIENSEMIPKNFKKKSKKLLEKHIDTYYEDYQANLANYKAEVKAIFDSARRAIEKK